MCFFTLNSIFPLVVLLSPSLDVHRRPINRVVGARNNDLIQKASRLRKWWTSVPKNHLARVRIQASFILKGEGLWLAVADILVLESFVLAAVQVGQVKMFLQQDKFLFSTLQLFTFL